MRGLLTGNGYPVMIYKFRCGRPHSLPNSYMMFANFYDPFDANQYGVYGILVKKISKQDSIKAFEKIREANVGTEIWYRNGQWEYAV